MKGFSATRTGLLDLDLPDFTAALDLLDPTLGGTAEQDYGVISYFGRLNYAYKNRYLLEANFRRDGSSRFGPDSRWEHSLHSLLHGESVKSRLWKK